MIRLAIVSPCYNEEAVLEKSAERLTALLDELVGKGTISRNSFMLFVNDGSRDRTWTIIERLYRENKYVKGLDLTRNVGHQSAIMAGMLTAKDMADGVITIDADLQDDLNAIPKMLEEYEKGYDIVYGVKVLRQADPLLKRMTAQAFYRLQSKMGIESIFNHADFRFMSRKALQILSQYQERNLYLRGLIPMIGLPSTTVDDIISEREGGVSKYTFGKMLGLALDGITSFSIRPIYGIIYLGLIFLLIALCIGIYVLHALLAGTAVPGWASLILSIWVTGGFLMIAVGTVGLYIGKIYREVKHRPLYNVKTMLE
ncbi:MAG: glycosyltransferase family 2 protein [Bacteroidaceae bacterium]|nr:glycosyltransferase family 2 protein [Bacteroidaceae bacterium]